MLTAKQVRATDIRIVVDDPEWQTVRKSLVGNWARNYDQNVKALDAYLEKHPGDPMVVRRVLNVMTGSVHRVGHTKGQASTDDLRRRVRLMWLEMLGDPFDPEQVRGPI